MPDVFDALPPDFAPSGRDEESLFSRDENDSLVRREKATRAQFDSVASVVIDGYPVKVPRAVPKTDAQGNPLRDADGGLVPRNSTIYDAATKLVHDGTWTAEELAHRIPVLCHQPHLHPVGVCRMCVVQIQQIKRGEARTERKLLPACQHTVADGMVVTTRAGVELYNPEALPTANTAEIDRFAKNIRSSVGVLVELLLADHRKPHPTPTTRYVDELEVVARAVGVHKPRPRLTRPAELPSRNTPADPNSRRFPLPIASTPIDPELLSDRDARRAWTDWNAQIDADLPYSSRTVVVDHDRCILCDRCVRSCSEVKPFKVIGHTGKGYGTRVSFDLDALMQESSCVQCGECMTACPTGALSVRRRVQPRNWPDSPTAIPQNPNTRFKPESGFLTADEMRDVWIVHQSRSGVRRVVFPFRSVPFSYLKWNEGSVRRWVVRGNEQRVLCREGEYGSTAFLLQGGGRFHIHARGSKAAASSPGWLARLLGRKNAEVTGLGPHVATREGTEFVLGEMACLTHRPRTASIVALADPKHPGWELNDEGEAVPTSGEPMAVVYEVTRNLLDMIQRVPEAREAVEEVYAARSLEACLQATRLLEGLPKERSRAVTDFLADRARPPAERARLIRLAPGEEVVTEGDVAHGFYVIRLGTVKVFNRVGGREQLRAKLGPNDYFGETALLSGEMREAGGVAAEVGRRTASVAAVDTVEVVLIPGPVFLKMCDLFPEVRNKLIQRATQFEIPALIPLGMLGEYVNQGLFQGQKLLALDLVSCTRCDECTRACADSHDGHSRLLREGLRFGDFLVATSCRSCHTPYCMDGCPVDAIHRKGDHLEVQIENHCIGCGLCERNCPYGAIQMVPRVEAKEGESAAVAARRAVNCDLCNGGEPFCVQACPHEAAFRLDGPTLLNEVVARANREGMS